MDGQKFLRILWIACFAACLALIFAASSVQLRPMPSSDQAVMTLGQLGIVALIAIALIYKAALRKPAR